MSEDPSTGTESASAEATTPTPPELIPALASFERGDFRGATAAATALLAGQPAPELADAARVLLARMAPDPWAVRVGLLALTLLAIVAAVFVR
jgi:hypothetical protein